jgi:hypothetical protein
VSHRCSAWFCFLICRATIPLFHKWKSLKNNMKLTKRLISLVLNIISGAVKCKATSPGRRY